MGRQTKEGCVKSAVFYL